MTSAANTETPVWGRWLSPASFVVCLLMAALSLRTAPVSLAKLLLFVVALGLAVKLAWLAWQNRAHSDGLDAWTLDHRPLAMAYASVACLFALALSMAWTTADAEAAVNAWVKSSKLLIPLLIVLCMRTPAQVRTAWWVLFAGQAVVLALTWWIVFDGRPAFLGPNNAANLPTNAPAPFTTYLDQALMHAVTAALAWHLRAEFGRPWTRYALTALAATCVVTCFLMPGRSGHLVVLGLIALGVFWTLPKRWVVLAGVVPMLLMVAVMVASPRTFERVQKGVAEAQQFETTGRVDTSVGERLHYWTTSARLMTQAPMLGFGVGSWNKEYLRESSGRPAPAHSRGIRNPHQEFLLWGVQLGAVGVALLCAWFACAAFDARHFKPHVRRAAWSAVAATVGACLFNAAIFDALIGDFLVCTIGLSLAHGLSHGSCQPAAPPRDLTP